MVRSESGSGQGRRGWGRPPPWWLGAGHPRSPKTLVEGSSRDTRSFHLDLPSGHFVPNPPMDISLRQMGMAHDRLGNLTSTDAAHGPNTRLPVEVWHAVRREVTCGTVSCQSATPGSVQEFQVPRKV